MRLAKFVSPFVCKRTEGIHGMLSSFALRWLRYSRRRHRNVFVSI